MSTSVENSIELAPEVTEFLQQPQHHAFVAGKWVDAEDQETLDVLDPGTGEKIACIPSMKELDVRKAVAAADAAFKQSGWATMRIEERCVALHRIADAVEARLNIFAQIESIDCGKIYSQAVEDIQNFVDTFRYFADMAQLYNYRSVIAVKGHEAWVARHPWGPCGFIIPWNFPFLLAGWGIGPALAAGNTCVLKPAEDTPLSALYLCKIVNDLDLLPAGVLNVVTGLGEHAGAAVANDPRFRRMSFTGSPEVGRLVAEVCGRNLVPVKCELGGKGAAVVFNDVDIPTAAEKLVGAITFHSGQVCCDATRWLIQKDIYDDFVDECITRMKSVQIGYPMDTTSPDGTAGQRQTTRPCAGVSRKGRQ
jgi:acyl-CoA reductase-like NAD-dependent aldehyde dehydrogenase